MDPQKRKKIIIAIIILVILGLLFWLWRNLNVFIPANNNNTNEPPKFVAPSSPSDFDPNLAPVLSSDELLAVNLAKNYAERFGTWSTDQPGVNLKELEVLSTRSMNNYLASIQIDYQATSYNGITTKSIAGQLESFATDSATVLVKTQRIETKADLSQDIYYQDIKLDLVKSNDKWLVDAAWWQDKK